MIRGNKAICSDEELDFLANAYLKLKQNTTYQNLSKTFREFIDEYLREELLALKKAGMLNGR